MINTSSNAASVLTGALINVAATIVATMVGLVLEQIGVPDGRLNLEWIST